MTTQTYNNLQEGLVQDMRKIRDQISNEIMDMTFQQERAYLDKLLENRKSDKAEHISNVIEAEEQSLQH